MLAEEMLTREDKLRHLLHIAENIPDDCINMTIWSNTYPAECKTVGCLLGWACLDPEFNKLGLTLRQSIRYINTLLHYKFPQYNKDSAFWYKEEAGEKFFELSIQEAKYLFLPTCYPKMQQMPIMKEMIIKHIIHVLHKEVEGITNEI